MSFNLSIGGQNGGDFSSVDSSKKIKDTLSITDETQQLVPVTINNSKDLKQAELSGEQYSISDEQLVKAIESAIKAVQGKTTTLEFSIHKQTKLISVKVLDKDTGETIREIPPEKSLDFVAKLWEMAGIFVDKRG